MSEHESISDEDLSRFREITSATGAMRGGQRPWEEVPEDSRELWRARYIATRDFFKEDQA